jgi:hypothetical protein
MGLGDDFKAAAAEFIGTAYFLFFGNNLNITDSYYVQ